MKYVLLLSCSLLVAQFDRCNESLASTSESTERSEQYTTHSEKSEPGPKENFEKYCTSCHGNEVNAFVDRRWKHGSTKADLVRSISKGIVNEGMPSYEVTFTTEEIEALAEYILNGISDRKSYSTEEVPTPKFYSTEKYKVQVDTIVENVGIPWGMKVTEDGSVYFTQKEGKFKLLKPTGELVEIKNVPKVVENVQGGLMDVVLHPDFDNNHLLYLSYTKPMGLAKTTTAVIRARLENDALVEIKDIFEAVPALARNYHYGCRMVFDNEDYLYITVGDRAKRDEHPQFLTNSCGKVHRMHDDGSIPEDNPFVDNTEAIHSIWSYGHRNPQGMIYDKVNDQVWTNEHGPRGGDELNLIAKGKNYGWPVISYGINYNGTTFTTETSQDGMYQPKNYWTPSIAPSGMAIVTGEKYPEWTGDILNGSLRFDYLSRIVVKEGNVVHEERILEKIGRVRCVEMGADGYIYVGVEESGRILRVSIAE